MYGQDLAKVLTKMRDLVIFVRDECHFLQAKSWMVGLYDSVFSFWALTVAYGITTGFGKFANVVISREKTR